jgi:hypothetical protein
MVRTSPWAPPLLALAGALFISSCVTARFQAGKTIYARNLEIEVNGVKCSGTCVAERAPKYEIKIKSVGDMDFLLVRTCHQSFKRENEGTDFKWTFTPVAGKEYNRGCPARYTGIDKEKGRGALGWIDFQDPRKTLPACLQCNGRSYCAPGVSACESAQGLVQGITFTAPVTYSTRSTIGEERTRECDTFKTTDGKTFEFRTPIDECTVTFEEKAPPYRQHRLSTYGFEQFRAGEF